MGILNIVKKKKDFEDTEDLEKDIASIMEFFSGIGRDIKEVHELIVKVKKLRKRERSEYDDKKQIKLLEKEIEAWDKFLERYVMIDRDLDVTSARIKKISKVLKEEAEKMKVKASLKKMVNKKDEWVFNW